jgi:hypothetical protein
MTEAGRDSDVDPDRAVPVRVREIAAALGLARALAQVADASPADAVALASALDDEAARLLPEVGPVNDVESFRLFVHRLHDRLAALVPEIGSTLSPPPVTIQTDSAVPIRRGSRSAAVVGDALADAFVWWDDITADDVAHYREVLDAATDERPLQRHLAMCPRLLVQHLGGGHGRWVLPQKRLGAEYVPDFVIGEKSSSGFEWQFVELQSPVARLFVTSSGRLGEQLDEGLRQISEWRRWLADNRDYARRPRSSNGLGLTDVSADDPGLLLIGREADLTEDDRERRRQLDTTYKVRIHTYDWLIRSAEARLADLAARRD